MKDILRQQIIQLRNNLDPKIRVERSREIWEKILVLPEYVNSLRIMIYLNFHSEVETIPFITKLQQDGKIVYAPVTDTLSKSLSVYPIPPDNPQLSTGSFGILQPKSTGEPLSPNRLDLIIVPGIAFDLSCRRIGYGGGYYDRFLPSIRNDTILIGIAYEIQIVNDILTDQYDVPMDLVITEQRIIPND